MLYTRSLRFSLVSLSRLPLHSPFLAVSRVSRPPGWVVRPGQVGLLSCPSPCPCSAGHAHAVPTPCPWYFPCLVSPCLATRSHQAMDPTRPSLPFAPSSRLLGLVLSPCHVGLPYFPPRVAKLSQGFYPTARSIMPCQPNKAVRICKPCLWAPIWAPIAG